MVWEEVFEEITQRQRRGENAEREKDRRKRYIVGTDPTALLKIQDPPDIRGMTTPYDRQRRDELAATYERAEQRVENYKDELQRLREEHAEIVRPDRRLWIGIVVLIAFAGLGVAWPMYVMSTGPTSLASVRWLIWP